MARHYQSWEVSDDFWQLVEPLVPRRRRPTDKEYRRQARGGRKSLPARKVSEAIVFVLRTGIQWKALPEEFGSSGAIHHYFQVWEKAGFFCSLWEQGLTQCDSLVGIDWEWQSIDTCKQVLYGTGRPAF